ncbi:MAG: asparagine synthase (glutamine-hydrolyzing) [Gemmatimonadetes bacterium]|nr:asparagine synthase (glutamine-hydrolyzing) [Gemmatimonadota bacterium]
MCGIAGIVALGPAGRTPDPAVVRAMAERLVHRGPDARTSWTSPSGRCALGHARLRVIDLETGGQPMANEDGTVQVVFNGEIYNFAELRRELMALGHSFRSTGDTEVIVHGWEAWGEGVVERLDGMFAFGLWDERRGRLLLARDRPGKKPLYWAEKDGALLFASEIKALLDAGVEPDADPRAFPLYLAYGYVPAPGTFYRAVRKLPPATLMTMEADGARRERRYWSLRFRSGDMRRGDAVERVRTTMEDAVRRRLVADVPLGAFLSGGIDSSVVVGLMSRLSDRPVRTFSIGFGDDPGYDETAYARRVADHFGSDHTEFRVEAGAVELVDRLVDAYDEPFGDSSAIPTSIVSGLAREHVTVALTGDGGDEIFAGYPRFLGMVIAERMPRWAARVGDALGRRLPHHDDFRHPTRRFSRFFHAAALPAEERMLRWIGFFADDVDALLRPGLAAALDGRALTAHFRAPLEAHAGQSPLARALALNFETYLPEDLLVKADRCSMTHGLELRSPFLDTAVMELAAGLPDRLRIRGGTLKWILREAYRDMLPPGVLSRGKMGFGIPLPMWFRTHWRPLLEARILAPEARLWSVLRPEPVRRMAEAHLAGTADFGHQLWALLTLETWLERAPVRLPELE